MVVNCEWFEIIDWDEETQEIYYAVCSMPSPCWPNCNRCQSRVEYKDVAEEEETPNNNILMRGAHGAVLLRSDVGILDGSINRSIRLTEVHDTEVRRLYKMYKQL
jgi:hypothetical protein